MLERVALHAVRVVWERGCNQVMINYVQHASVEMKIALQRPLQICYDTFI